MIITSNNITSDNQDNINNIILNSYLDFRESTIRPDDGIEGAILVDCVLISEANLLYDENYQKIPAHELKNKSFLESLHGINIFINHPELMLSADNYGMIYKSVGSIVSARVTEEDNLVSIVGTLRIIEPNTIELIKSKQLNGGSLGYYAQVIDTPSGKMQINLKPNHYALTNKPRDKRVQLFNSKEKGKMNDTFDKESIEKLVIQTINNSYDKQGDIRINRNLLVSLLNSIEDVIPSEKVKNELKTSDTLQKAQLLNSYFKVGEGIVKNSEDEKTIEQLRKENDELRLKLEKKMEDKSTETTIKKEEIKKENEDFKNQINDIDDKEKEKKNEDKDDDKKENEDKVVEEKKEITKEEVKDKEEVKNSLDYVIPSASANDNKNSLAMSINAFARQLN